MAPLQGNHQFVVSGCPPDSSEVNIGFPAPGNRPFAGLQVDEELSVACPWLAFDHLPTLKFLQACLFLSFQAGAKPFQTKDGTIVCFAICTGQEPRNFSHPGNEVEPSRGKGLRKGLGDTLKAAGKKKEAHQTEVDDNQNSDFGTWRI